MYPNKQKTFWVNFLLGRRAVGFLSSWFLGLPNSLNCKVASNLALVEVHWLYGTTSFFLFKYEFKYSHFCLGKTLENSTDEYEGHKNEVYVFNRETGHWLSFHSNVKKLKTSGWLPGQGDGEKGEESIEEKKEGETEGKKLPQIFWDTITFNQSIERPETATWSDLSIQRGCLWMCLFENQHTN